MCSDIRLFHHPNKTATRLKSGLVYRKRPDQKQGWQAAKSVALCQ